MNIGRGLAGLLLVAAMVAGCQEFSQKMALRTDQRPVDPMHETPFPEVSSAAKTETMPPGDANAAQAVREFLAGLDAARSESQAADSAAPPAGDLPSPAPQQADVRTARANEPLELHARGEADAAVDGDMPAVPVVLAASLIGDAAADLKVAAEPVATIGVHQGLDTAIPSHQVTLQRLIESAEEALAEDPASIEKQWQLSLLQLAADQPREAGSLSPALAQQPRELLSGLVKAAGSAYRMMCDPLADSDEVLVDIDELRALLRKDAELQIPVVALCTKVTTFGVYDALPAQALRPYQTNRVIVYCEVENFAVEEQGPQQYHSLLAARLELLTSEGRSLWLREEHKIEDVAKQRREDFFLAQLITLPADLPPGEYVLKAAITDLLASKTNEAAFQFTIPGADVASAAVP